LFIFEVLAMPLGTLKKWRSCVRPALSCLSLLAAACIIPACTSGNKNHAAPPAFGGLVSASSTVTGQVDLTWVAAVDFAGGGITYEIFVGNGGSGSEVASGSTASSTGTTISQWGPGNAFLSGNTYWIIVQAFDSLGQSDGNSVERAVVAH
jgi:hypothetical protein